MNLSSNARGLGQMYARLPKHSIACIPCRHVVFPMLLWLYLRCRDALFCNGAGSTVWVGLV